MKPQNYESFITKICKDEKGELQLSREVVISLNKIIHILLEKIVSSVDISNSAFVDKREKLTAKLARLGVNLIFPEGEMSEQLISCAEKAVMKFQTSGIEKDSKTTQSYKAGITIPPSRVRHDIERVIMTFSQISKEAPVFLAAVLDGFLRRILRLSGEETEFHKKKRINIRDMRLAIGNDGELNNLIGKHHIILPGGVMPWIDDSLLPKDE